VPLIIAGNASLKPYANPTPTPTAMAAAIPHISAEITEFSIASPICNWVVATTNTMAYKIPVATNAMVLPPTTPLEGSSRCIHLPTKSAMSAPITSIIMKATTFGIHNHTSLIA
jgi:hypothetical protein